MNVPSTAVAPQAETLPWLLGRAIVLTWLELPRVVLACAVLLASIAPFAAAATSGQGWLIFIGAFPAALIITGLSRFAAAIARGDRPRVGDLVAVDPVLAVSIVALGTAVAMAIASGVLQIAGFILGAAGLVLLPYALAYAATRDRRGLTAWRGAFLLVAYRPSWALTVLSVYLIGGFAIAATVGALAILVPCTLAVFASRVVSQLLDTIDTQASG